MNKTAVIFDIQRFSIHDGPGIRTNVFLKGCNLSCLWCANPESKHANPELLYQSQKCILCGKCVDLCEAYAIIKTKEGIFYDRTKCNNCGKCTEHCYTNARRMAGESYSKEQVMKEILKDIAFYKNSGGGVTFSGGEPMLRHEFIKEIAGECRKNGISVAIETAGNVPWHNFQMMVDVVDYFLFDLKIWNNEKHSKYCGCSNKLILENIVKLSKMEGQFDLSLRVPIIPGINSDENEIREIGAFAASLGNIKKVHILPYHNFGESKYFALSQKYNLEGLAVPTSEDMNYIRDMISEYGLDVQIGG